MLETASLARLVDRWGTLDDRATEYICLQETSIVVRCVAVPSVPGIGTQAQLEGCANVVVPEAQSELWRQGQRCT